MSQFVNRIFQALILIHHYASQLILGSLPFIKQTLVTLQLCLLKIEFTLIKQVLLTL